MKVNITGGGFLARYVASELVRRGHYVDVFTRSEANAVTLRDFVNDPKCRVIIRDLFDLTPEGLGDCCPVVHTAAMKHVDLCAAHHEVAMRQNIAGTQRIIALTGKTGARLIHISTDKAIEATTLYGATKLIAERLAAAAGATIARLPNLFGSTGSVIPRWVELVKTQAVIPVTHRDMMRHFCHPRTAASMICDLVDRPQPGKVVIPPSYEVSIAKLADLVGSRTGLRYRLDFIGLRGGEKLREVMCLPSETNIASAHTSGPAAESMIWDWVCEFVPQLGTENVASHPVFPEG